MFEQSLLQTRAAARTTCAVGAGLASQTALASLALLVPLVYTQTLRPVMLYTGISVPPASAPSGPPPMRSGEGIRRVVGRPFTRVFTAPAAVPAGVKLVVEQPDGGSTYDAPRFGVPGGVGDPVGAISTVMRGIISVVPPAAEPVARPAAVPSAPAPPVRIKVGGLVQEGRLISAPRPMYPPLARQARISGVVRIEAVVGVDGRIQSLRAASGHPLLIPAAVEAVRHWIYRPAYLNGDPVEVSTEITVNFTLQ